MCQREVFIGIGLLVQTLQSRHSFFQPTELTDNIKANHVDTEKIGNSGHTVANGHHSGVVVVLWTGGKYFDPIYMTKKNMEVF